MSSPHIHVANCGSISGKKAAAGYSGVKIELFNTKIWNRMNLLVFECCLTRSVPLMDQLLCDCLLVDCYAIIHLRIGMLLFTGGRYVHCRMLCLPMDIILLSTDGQTCQLRVIVYCWWIVMLPSSFCLLVDYYSTVQWWTMLLSSGGLCCCPVVDCYLLVHWWSALLTRPSPSCRASVHRLVLELYTTDGFMLLSSAALSCHCLLRAILLHTAGFHWPLGAVPQWATVTVLWVTA